MPAPPPPADWRAQILPLLFWIGVALAPIAALLLLLGQGGSPLRIAAVLTLVCVVLIGLSVALRNDVETVRVEVEATVLDEADAIREETREDIVAVARKLHSALRREIADLSEQVEDIRGRVSHDTRRPVPDLSEEAAAYTRGVVRRTETVRVTTRQTTVSDESGRSSQRQPTSHSRAARTEPAATAPSRAGSGRAAVSRPALASHVGADYAEGADSLDASRPGLGTFADQAGPSAGRRHWDPLSDDLADRPADLAAPSVPGQGGRRHADESRRGGRRRAAEPDEPLPVAELESGRRDSDPWADLRGSTQPAEVRFGARDSSSGSSRYSGGYRGYGSRGYDSMERVPVRPEPRRPEPGPLDPGWRGTYLR